MSIQFFVICHIKVVLELIKNRNFKILFLDFKIVLSEHYQKYKL